MSTLVDLDQHIASLKKESDVMQKVRILTDLTKSREVKIKDIAAKMGVKSSYVCHLLRLNRLPEAVIDGFYSDSITLSHLFIISRVKEAEKIIEIYEKVLAHSLTVKGTEEVVREVLYGLKTEGEYLTPEEKEAYVSKITGHKKNVKLNIIQTRIKSKIVLELEGNLDKTSKEVRRILNRLESVEE